MSTPRVSLHSATASWEKAEFTGLVYFQGPYLDIEVGPQIQEVWEKGRVTALPESTA